MVYYRGSGATFHRCQIAQQLLGTETTSHNWHALQCVDRIDIVLWRLYGDQILHSVLRVEPVIRCCLTTRTQRHEHIVGHITLGQTHLTGPRAVDLHEQLRGVHDLVQVDVYRTRDARYTGLDLLGNLIVLWSVAADHLDINRGW